MATTQRTIVGGVVRATWDDDLEQYQEFAANGTTVTLTRAYTQVEKEAKAERSARATQIANYNSTKSAIAAGISGLQADIATLQQGVDATAAAVNANPATFIKPMCQIMIRLENATIGLARIVADQLG